MGARVTMTSRRLALALGLMATFTGWVQAADLMDEVRSRGALRVAVEGTYAPFNFKDPKTGQMTGYDIDVARLVADRLGVRPQFVPLEWSAVLPAVASGKVDVAISQVVITPERKRTFDFSTPYTYSSFQLIVRANERANYLSLADLKGRTVGVRQGSVFEQLVETVPGIEVKRYPAAPENLQDLAFGRIDAVLDMSLMVAYLVKTSQLPVKAGPRVGRVESVGVAMRKGDPQLREAVDDILEQARADGSLRTISMKWFGIDASAAP